MIFKNILTGAILKPKTKFVIEQMKKNENYVVYLETTNTTKNAEKTSKRKK